jgi:hypothetical protein
MKFNDPLADKIQWDSIATLYTSFHSKSVVPVNKQQLALRPSRRFYVLCGLFFSTAMLCLYLFYSPGATIDWGAIQSPILKALLPGVIILLFLCLGGIAFSRGRHYTLFDKRRGSFYTQGKETAAIPLKQVHALQIILVKYYNPNTRLRNATTHELNLVLENGKRINLLTERSHRIALQSATYIAEFLHIPIWDATTLPT